MGMREKLIALLKLSPSCICDLCGENGRLDEVAEIIADNLIANGVTIPVRCKDCKKRYKPNECPLCILVYGEQHDVTHDDGYCDRGERRSDAETD